MPITTDPLSMVEVIGGPVDGLIIHVPLSKLNLDVPFTFPAAGHNLRGQKMANFEITGTFKYRDYAPFDQTKTSVTLEYKSHKTL